MTAEIKHVLQEAGFRSQYLEVGIGPDVKIFTKCPPMASVGFGPDVGLHPVSRWKTPSQRLCWPQTRWAGSRARRLAMT